MARNKTTPTSAMYAALMTILEAACVRLIIGAGPET
jgi:hypothetical protein